MVGAHVRPDPAAAAPPAGPRQDVVDSYAEEIGRGSAAIPYNRIPGRPRRTHRDTRTNTGDKWRCRPAG